MPKKKRKVDFEFKTEVDDTLLSELTVMERKIVDMTLNILNSSELETLRDKHLNGQRGNVTLGDLMIEYSDDLPCDDSNFGFSMFEDYGFVLFCSAFKNKMELTKTILHEVCRLCTSQVKDVGCDKNIAKLETAMAFNFSNDIYNKLFSN